MPLDRSEPEFLTNPPTMSVVAFLTVCAGLAAALLRYGGLQHDAQVYVAQALLRTGQTPLSGDLFFRYGSQDDFTLFPSFAAIFVETFGIDHGAAVLTGISLAILLGAIWLLTRTLVGAGFAWIAVPLMIVLPAWYGSAEVFQVAERFMTARLPAVGLSLLAMAALIAGRVGWSISLMALAFVTHPLMALPVIVIGAMSLLVDRHRHLRQPLISVALLVAVLAAGMLLGGSTPSMDSAWLSAVRLRSDFLFLDSWRVADWQNAVMTLTTVAIVASISDRGPARSLIVSAAAVAAVGMAAAAFTTWAFPIKWVIQAQTWRWMWPTTVLAIALLPWVLTTLVRRHGAPGLAGAATLACAWIVGSADRSNDAATLASIALAMGCVSIVLLRKRVPERHKYIWCLAGVAVAIVSAFWTLALAASEVSFRIDLGGDPYWVQKTIALLRIPAVAGICITLMGLAISERRSRLAPTLTIVASLALLFGAVPQAVNSWTKEQFGADVRARFAPWRVLISEHDEVFWPDQLQATWFALDRRSYLSVSQLGGIVFSAEMTFEALRRAQSIAGVFPVEMWLGRADRKDKGSWTQSDASLREICSVPEIDFVVTSSDVGSDVPGIPWPLPGRYVYLYECRGHRGDREID